jgi:hypothetical protein
LFKHGLWLERDVPFEDDTLPLRGSHKVAEIFDLEGAASSVTWFFFGEVCRGQLAAAAQIVLHLPVFTLVAG